MGQEGEGRLWVGLAFLLSWPGGLRLSLSLQHLGCRSCSYVGCILGSQGCALWWAPTGQLIVHRPRSGPKIGTWSGNTRTADTVTQVSGHACPMRPKQLPAGPPLLGRRHVCWVSTLPLLRPARGPQVHPRGACPAGPRDTLTCPVCTALSRAVLATS